MAIFKDARKLQGERVRMHFDDGREVVAQLLCATKDMDGSRHLIYDRVESGVGDGATNCCYADGKSLVRIEHADKRENTSGPRGTHFSMPKVA